MAEIFVSRDFDSIKAKLNSSFLEKNFIKIFNEFQLIFKEEFKKDFKPVMFDCLVLIFMMGKEKKIVKKQHWDYLEQTAFLCLLKCPEN